MTDAGRASRLWLVLALALQQAILLGSELEAGEQAQQARSRRNKRTGGAARRRGRPVISKTRPRGREQSVLMRGVMAMRAAESGGKNILPAGRMRAEALPTQVYPVSRVAKSSQLKKQRREEKRRNRLRTQTAERREQRAAQQAIKQAEVQARKLAKREIRAVKQAEAQARRFASVAQQAAEQVEMQGRRLVSVARQAAKQVERQAQQEQRAAKQVWRLAREQAQQEQRAAKQAWRLAREQRRAVSLLRAPSGHGQPQERQVAKQAQRQAQQEQRAATQAWQLAREQAQQEQRAAKQAWQWTRTKEPPASLVRVPSGQGQPLEKRERPGMQRTEAPSSQTPSLGTPRPPRGVPLLRLSRGRLQPPHRLVRTKIRHEGDHGPACGADP
jgi:hypothetical protein